MQYVSYLVSIEAIARLIYIYEQLVKRNLKCCPPPPPHFSPTPLLHSQLSHSQLSCTLERTCVIDTATHYNAHTCLYNHHIISSLICEHACVGMYLAGQDTLRPASHFALCSCSTEVKNVLGQFGIDLILVMKWCPLFRDYNVLLHVAMLMLVVVFFGRCVELYLTPSHLMF